MKILRATLWFLGLVHVCTACLKDEPPTSGGASILLNNDVVYITNEGNFGAGNASISAYNIVDSTLVEDIYNSVNSLPLGDVCQSMRLHNGKAYLVVNNSGKIEVVNADNFRRIGTISGMPSPRYLLPISNSKAYVTDLYGQSISVIDMNNMQKTATISCSGWTEEAHLIYGKVFVTNRYREKVYVIETSTDSLIDSIPIGYGANSIVEDKNGNLWVLCNGDILLNKTASLHCIDPVGHSVVRSFSFASLNQTPWRLRINGSFDTLYYINNGVFSMPIMSGTLPTLAFIEENGRNFYGLGIHPHTSEIFVSDAKDYNQRGRIYQYYPNGLLSSSFLAGIIPGDFFFP